LRLTPPFGQRGELRRRFFERSDRLQPEDRERPPQQLVVAPAVHHRERLRSVEVVVERNLELRPAPDWLAR